MIINQIHLDHLGPIEDETIVPGHVTIFEGPNGSGKSLRMKAIRSALQVAGRGKDYSGLLDEDVPFGSTTVISTDVTLIQSYHQEGSDLTVKAKGFRDQTGASADKYVREVFDPISVNAESFLIKDAKERTRIILESIPFELDAQELHAILPDKELHLVGHPLEVVDRIYKGIFDERTDLNRASKEALLTAKRIYNNSASPVDLDALNIEIAGWEQQLEELRATKDESIERENIARSTRLSTLQDAGVKVVAASLAQRDRIIQDLRDQIKIEEDRHSAFVTEKREEFVTAKSIGQDVFDEFQTECNVMFEEQSSSIRSNLEGLRAARDREIEAKGIRSVAWESEQAGERLKWQAAELTDKLQALNDFKGSMLHEIPIPGIGMEDGLIVIDGKRWDEVPDSRLCILAIDLAIARGAEPMLVDGLDKLDDKNFALVLTHLQQCPRQSFVARWNRSDHFTTRTLDKIN